MSGRKLFFSFVILATVLLSPVAAQNRETLAVLDFTTEAVSETEMNAIVEFLSAELFNTDKYIVIDVSQRETILTEMEFSNQGCTDESCALEIGKLLSAELIVVGNLSKVGSRYLMSVKMLQTETSRTMGTANGKFNDLDELIDGLEAIAVTLAGKEKETVAVATPEPESEPEPEAAQPIAVAAEEPAKPVEAEAQLPAAPDKADEEEKAPKESGSFNILSFAASALGAGEFVTAGIFRNMGFVSRLKAEDAYNVYMTAVIDPGLLYSGDGDTDYEHYYNRYESQTRWSYITSGIGGGLSSASFYLGDSYMSFGGKLTYAAGAAALAAGNFLSAISFNNAFSSTHAYEDYLSAGTDEAAQALWENYSGYYDSYQIQQFISYGLWGAGGLLSIGSWFIPGDKTPAVSGILNKIIMTAGYLFFTGGNFTSSIATNTHFTAEEVYDDYMSASTSEAASYLYDDYQKKQEFYEIMTYTTYGLWGVGAAAVITAMLLPSGSGHAVTSGSENFTIRPSLTGIGVEVNIRLR